MNNLLTAAEAAQILEVSKSRVYSLVKSGRLKVKDGYITHDSVIKQKENRRIGRPIGSSRLKSPNKREGSE